MNNQLLEADADVWEVVPASPPDEYLRADDMPNVAVNEHSILGLSELLLKRPGRLDELTRDMEQQRELIPRFLAISLASFGLFALVLSFLLWEVPRTALPAFLTARWSDAPLGSAVSLTLAYTVGLVAATGVCLPSFYFYALLAGVKISVLHVTAHIMKGKSATSMLLLGILPIYVAIVMGMIVFNADVKLLTAALYLGLLLPFLAGVWGVRSIFQGFMSLADTLPPQRRCARTCFLRRLTLACAACYTAVTPVMIYTLWDYFARKLV
jgi:hypothetical protein